MTDLIGRLVVRVGLLLIQRRRHPTPPSRPAPTAPPPAPPTTLPAHRSPYGPDGEAPLDGDASRSVRPYLVAHEQRQRRRELAMAALGLDMPGPHWIHGCEVA